MAYDLGNTAFLELEVNPFDGTTAATVTATAPSDAASSPAATTDDAGNHWTATVVLNEAGTWTIRWETTGTGAGVKYQTIEVDEAPPATEAQGDVRLLIADTDSTRRMFSTLQIAAFLRLNGDNTRRAAAQALDVMASNEAMVSKVIKTQDLSTDGAKVADALRKQAAELRRQADDGEDGSDDAGFEIAEFEPYQRRYPWGY
jgi:hypothetical protein